MILNNFKITLDSEGVNEIKVSKGDEFNANLHHAIEEAETDEMESGKIYEIKMKGYKIHDKLLRPTTVIVSKSIETKEENNRGMRKRRNRRGTKNMNTRRRKKRKKLSLEIEVKEEEKEQEDKE